MGVFIFYFLYSAPHCVLMLKARTLLQTFHHHHLHHHHYYYYDNHSFPSLTGKGYLVVSNRIVKTISVVADTGAFFPRIISKPGRMYNVLIG